MSEESVAVIEALPATEVGERRFSAKQIRWFELALVLSIAFAHPLIGSLNILRYGKSAIPAQQGMTWTANFIHALTCLSLLVYVLSRRRMRLRDLGLRWSWRDILRGIGLTVGAYVVYAIAYAVFSSFHRHAAGVSAGVGVRDVYGHMSLLTIPFLLLNPFFEELIVRAYLMSEIGALTGSWTLAVVVSTVFQASYHLYYGWMGAVTLGFQFLVLSIYYARSRRITPVIFAHEVFDLLLLLHPW